MGLIHEIAHGSLRISLGRDNTEEDIAYTLEVLPQIIARLRSMSPLCAENSLGVTAKECKTCYKK
jgi:cysteine desulfurase